MEITSMLVELAHPLGLTVTAEAMETAEQAAGATDVPALAGRRLGRPDNRIAT